MPISTARVLATSASIVALACVPGAIGSGGTLRPDLALAAVGEQRSLLFTQRFCERGSCRDADVGVTTSGRADLPVLVGARGGRVAFELGFPAASSRLTVRSRDGSEETLPLPDRVWQVPAELALPASLRLEVEGEGRRATFVALVDETAPPPRLDRPAVRVRGTASGRRVFELAFRLCSQQTGSGEALVVESRRGGERRAKRALPRSHTPGCRSYRLAHASSWNRPGDAERLTLRVSVAGSTPSAPLRLR